MDVSRSQWKSNKQRDKQTKNTLRENICEGQMYSEEANGGVLLWCYLNQRV